MRKQWKARGVLLGLFMTIGVVTQTVAAPAQATIPQQPPQPIHGPGGSEISSHSVIPVKIADGGQGGWLFLPAEQSSASVPVVIFCHGWSAIVPRGYQAWIDHLVKRGNIVLWPNYQENLRTRTRQFVPNAVVGVKTGISLLQSGKYGVRPDLNRIAVVGHSAGGMVAAGIAATAGAEGLPKVKALMPIEPGDSQRGGLASVPLADLSHLPADMLMIILVGQEDTSVGTHDGERILHESTSVPEANKALFMLHSDDHGIPALIANHYTPSAVLNQDGSYAKEPVKQVVSRNTADIGVVDALDYLGTWRLLDKLLDTAFGKSAEKHPFQNPDILGMGMWSDGVPVHPLTRLR